MLILNVFETQNDVAYKTTDSEQLKLKKGKTSECIIETIANSNLLHISISGMPVAEASLTISYSVSLPIRLIFFDLIASS